MSTTQSKPDHPPHRAAALWGLLIMPLSSLFYVNYGVRLFGFLDLPNPIGPGAADGRNRPVDARHVCDAVAAAARNHRPGARPPFRDEGPAHSSHVAATHEAAALSRIAQMSEPIRPAPHNDGRYCEVACVSFYKSIMDSVGPGEDRCHAGTVEECH